MVRRIIAVLATTSNPARLGEPDDIAKVALFLASEYADRVTGHLSWRSRMGALDLDPAPLGGNHSGQAKGHVLDHLVSPLRVSQCRLLADGHLQQVKYMIYRRGHRIKLPRHREKE